MKRSLQIIAILSIVAVVITSCSAGSDDPKAVLKSFFERLAKKDIDGAAKLATADSKSTLDMVKKGIDMGEKMKDSLPQQDPMKEFKEAEFSEAKINGNTATVTVTNKANKGQAPADFTLVKENGKWLVDFSMATLMKMGQQQMGHQESTTDSLGINFNHEDIEAAKKSVDSVMKNIDPKQLEEIQKQVQKMQKQP